MFVLGISLASCGGPRKTDYDKPSLPDTAAFEKAHFGMTDKEYDKLAKDTIAMVGNSIFALHPFFIPKDRRMYRLQLRSYEVGQPKFDTNIKTCTGDLIDYFTTLYGYPHHMYDDPKIAEMEPRHVIWKCEWDYPNKIIKVGVAQLPVNKELWVDNRKFIAVCEITNKPLLKVANEQVIYTDLP